MIGLNGAKVELALVKIQMVHHQEIFIVMVSQLVQIGLKKEDRDSMYGYVFQYTNDNVDIGSNSTNLNTDSYSFALYDTKLRDDQFFTDSVIGLSLLHIDHQRVINGML